MSRLSNTPAPENLLLTAREALKSVLRDPDADHTYTIRMVMNAMGIAARAMQSTEPAPVHGSMSDADFRDWVRGADRNEVVNPGLIRALRRHVEDKLSVTNPRFHAETMQDQS